MQVMAREMFNPNLSLFMHMPEGGTTFQPNPNSSVQNDEVRGTNHLDFFKFVGRIVGKALYDGQFIDAYFTRSFYKHMLGQTLTYEVPPWFEIDHQAPTQPPVGERKLKHAITHMFLFKAGTRGLIVFFKGLN